MTPKQAAEHNADRFTKFLSAHPTGSLERRLRMNALKACLEHLKVERISDIREQETVEALASALTVPYLPAGTKPEELRPEPGPAISMTRANTLAKRSGEDVTFCIVYLEGESGGWETRETIYQIALRSSTGKTIEAARTYHRIKSVDNALKEIEAEERGELWKVSVAIYPERCLIVLRRGFNDGEWEGIFEAENQDALAFAEHTLIGSEREARVEAARFFYSKKTALEVIE